MSTTELTEMDILHQRRPTHNNDDINPSSPSTPSTPNSNNPSSPQKQQEPNILDSNPYSMALPFYHPRFQQQSLHPNEGIHHWSDFKTFMMSYWTSLTLTMHGLFIRTPKDAKDEVVYFAKNPTKFLIEILCGITIAIVVLPEAISFAHMVDMPPLSGLHSGMIIAMACALMGSRPAMISGAAASTFSILGALAKNDSYMEEFSLQERHDIIFMAIILSGCLEIILSWTQLAPYFIRLLPQSVLIGFVNGLAISIFKSQFHIFQKCMPVEGTDGIFTVPKFDQCPKDHIIWFNMGELELWLVLILIGISILIMIFFPKVPKVGKIIPPSLICFILCSILEHFLFRKAFGWHTRTLEDSTPLEGGFPKFSFPQVRVTATTNPWLQIFIYSLYVGVVGCLESLLTVVAMNQTLRVRTSDQDLNREAFAQGVGNVISGCFSCLGGCGTVGESILNIISGSRHRLSAIATSLTILVVILWATPAVNLIPMATLTAVIFCITFHTFYWPTLVIWQYVRKSDLIIIVAVTILSIFTNLGIGTLVGIGIASITLVLDSYDAFTVDIIDMSLPIPKAKKDINKDGDDDEQNNFSAQATPQQSTVNDDSTVGLRLNTFNTPSNTTQITSQDGFPNIPGSSLFSPTADETTTLNQAPMPSPTQSIQGTTTPGQTDEKSKTKTNESETEEKSPTSGSIYALDNYQDIDEYICYKYIPAPMAVLNPLAVLIGDLSPNDQNNGARHIRNSHIGENSKTKSDHFKNGQHLPTTIDSDDELEEENVHNKKKNDGQGTDLKNDIKTNNTSTPPSSPFSASNVQSDTVLVKSEDIINKAAYIAQVRLYRLHGIMFFGSVRAVNSNIVPALDPEFVIIDCSEVILTDYSASSALVALLHQYCELNKRCKLVHVNSAQAKKTILRDKALGRMLSRIDQSTYIVLTAEERKIRRTIKLEVKNETKAQKKLARLQARPDQ